MQQIADWLEKLGLGQYAQRFAENDIDFDILSDLTDQDLETVGVTSVGHRRKLLRAIANLKGLEKITPAVGVAVAPPRSADTARAASIALGRLTAFKPRELASRTRAESTSMPMT